MLFVFFAFSLVSGFLEISLEAKWKGPSEGSLKQEISEYFSELNQFWSFLEKDLTLPLAELLPQVSRDETEQSLILTSLHNREFSARIEFYASLERKHQSSCTPFYIINSVYSCDLSEALAAPAVSFSSPFDHVFHTGQGHLIAYLDISSPDFLILHRNIIAFTQKFDLTYILRHLDLRSNTADYLGGYGTEMIMKNMEYRPTEDRSGEIIPLPKWDLEDIPLKTIAQLVKLEKIEEVLNFLETLPENIKNYQDTPVSKSISDSLSKLNLSNVRNT